MLKKACVRPGQKALQSQRPKGIAVLKVSSLFNEILSNFYRNSTEILSKFYRNSIDVPVTLYSIATI